MTTDSGFFLNSNSEMQEIPLVHEMINLPANRWDELEGIQDGREELCEMYPNDNQECRNCGGIFTIEDGQNMAIAADGWCPVCPHCGFMDGDPFGFAPISV